MLRYKLLLRFRKNNLETSNLQAIENLENTGMLDLMIHQKRRWESINRSLVENYSPWYVFDKWVRS